MNVLLTLEAESLLENFCCCRQQCSYLALNSEKLGSRIQLREQHMTQRKQSCFAIYRRVLSFGWPQKRRVKGSWESKREGENGMDGRESSMTLSQQALYPVPILQGRSPVAFTW